MYTVYHEEDLTPAKPGLTLEEAAKALLTYDGHEFEIRDEANSGFGLYYTPFNRNGTIGNRPMVATTFFSVKNDRNDAQIDIFQQVIESGHWTPMDAMLDNEYQHMLAQMADENAK